MVNVGDQLRGEEDMERTAFDRSGKRDDALHYVTYLMFDRLRLPNLSCKLYSKDEEWSEPLRYVLGHGLLLQEFQNPRDSAVAVFKII